MVGFNYRRVPGGRAGPAAGGRRAGSAQIRHVRALYLQDWIVDPEFPLVWRLQKDKAGSGALGDIGAHIVDLAQFVTGERLTGVSALTETFVKERPLPAASSGLSARRGGTGARRRSPSTTRRCSSAGSPAGRWRPSRRPGSPPAARTRMRLEVNGSRGSLAFDFESMNELSFYDGTRTRETAGFRRILVTEPSTRTCRRWWPPGHLLGYEHSFTHEVRRPGRGDRPPARDPTPSFADGLQVQRVLDAVEAVAPRSRQRLAARRFAEEA